MARILAFLAFFNFFLYSIDRWAPPPGHAVNGVGVRLDRIGKQTGLAPLNRAFAVLLFFMGNFVFLIFIMAQPHGQILSR